MRVLFVNPPDWNGVRYPTKAAMGNVADFPPIGMLLVATFLEHNLDVDVRLFDYNRVNRNDYAAVDRVLEEFRPDVVGIASFTFQLYDIYEIARQVKRRAPATKIVLGAKHVELFPHETLVQEFVDYLVVGEGEEPMRALVETLGRGATEPDIPGVWYRKNGTVVEGGRAPRIRDLDALPAIDLSILEGNDYSYSFGSASREAMIVTSRGCPFACQYCVSAHPDRRFIGRSPEHVVDEVKHWFAAGYRHLNFFDDYFNADLERAKEICHRLIEERLPVSWTMRGSANQIDEEFAELLQASGCKRVNIGVESANEEILAAFGRKSSTARIQQSFDLLARRGISLMGYFMLGFPGESREMVEETIDLALSLPLDYAQFTAVCPTPGSQFYSDLVRRGKLDDVYRDFVQRPWPAFRLPYYEDLITEAEIAALCQSAYRRFYLRPTLVWRHVRALRSGSELVRKTRLAASLIGYSLTQKLRVKGRTGGHTNRAQTARRQQQDQPG